MKYFPGWGTMYGTNKTNLRKALEHVQQTQTHHPIWAVVVPGEPVPSVGVNRRSCPGCADRLMLSHEMHYMGDEPVLRCDAVKQED